MKYLSFDSFQKGLKTKTFGRSFLALSRATSTNDVAFNLIHQGALEGTVIAAEEQTKGRGRQGRRWTQTPGKGLAFSVILRPRMGMIEAAGVTLAAGVAAAKTLEDFGLKPRIKWPNDLLLNGKKVCGILTEMGPKKDKMGSVVLGIGVNLNQTKRDFPGEIKSTATSVYLSSGKKTNRVRFFQRLLLHLEESYGWLAEDRFSKVLAEWRKREDSLNRQVKVTQSRRVFYGQAVGLDERGALLVRNDSGIVETVHSGDVVMLKSKIMRR